ncbi:MAG: thioredoxin [Candidatus Gastranaerophilales bacterium]|nr:thioredoxin [Candidatus Gastranaerophilales bacterium]
MADVIEISDESFDNEVLKESKLTLVDFWATWCGPCRKLSPVIDELAKEFDGKAKFVKIKADENLETAQKYSISGVPCLIIFKNGEPVERIVNIVPKSIIVNNLNKHL